MNKPHKLECYILIGPIGKLRRKRSVVNAKTGAKLVLLSVCELMNESLDQNIAVLF